MENEGVIEEGEPVFENNFLPTGHQIDILADEVFFRDHLPVNMGVMIQYE